jgi:hypothetical protein
MKSDIANLTIIGHDEADAREQTTGKAAGVPGAYTDLALSPDGTRAVVAVS